MLRISTQMGHERMSTQDLLLQIANAVAAGETNFFIAASGQHDIGGPLWNRKGKELHFQVTNPGQRVGAMGLPGTNVIVEGSAPADVGWLNSGATVTIKGDAGDTAGHCAAAGRIYIGGRAGTRSGSLMKHDPDLEPPQLWVLNSVGSFSFEFMSGGYAIVCGHNSQTLPSVLGNRPGVGMVGGVVYFRGPCGVLPADVEMLPLTDEDIAWLTQGMGEFLSAIGQEKLLRELNLWKHWHKLVPATATALKRQFSVAHFHREKWQPLFDYVYPDDLRFVVPLVPTGENRLAIPHWDNMTNGCNDCHICMEACPQGAVRRREAAAEKGDALHRSSNAAPQVVYSVNENRCIGCGICATMCPRQIWHMEG